MIASENDFEAHVLQSGVNVFFKPTRSHYSFLRLKGEYVSRFGTLSHEPSIRHAGPTGDTGEYDPGHVLEMAYQAALKTAIQA
jgi:hypothetical protein